MIVEPKTKGFICTTAHPVGCAAHVQEQIDYVQSQQPIINGPKKVLVVGASTGFGLSSRIVTSFGGSEAGTIGVFFERESDGRKTASAGWYNSVAFEQKAVNAGYYAKSFNGDAFSNEMKAQVIETIKKDWEELDLLIYSLASPRRKHPVTGDLAKSVLKPLGKSYTNKSLDLSKKELETVTLDQATEDDINQTISVMGGEDWSLWVEALEKEGLFKKGAMAVAYSYIGPEITQGVYRNGTIGKAKEHLEATAKELDARMQKIGGRALISVNKALVTQSSSAIPFIPLYYVLLNKIMKEKNIDEGCIEQMYRLFANRLYTDGDILLDENGFIRIDDLELRADVQQEVNTNWERLTEQNLHDLADIKGYDKDFLKLFGFGLKGVDYSADVEIDLKLPSTVNV